jgi:uncharacterized protein (DUF2236 family)
MIDVVERKLQMDPSPAAIVTAGSLECELERVRAAAENPLAGPFGPRSLTWQVDREAAIFLGAGRALLLQLAHPWVAAAIAQHSNTLADPIGRFHRTFGVVFSLVFGSLDQSIGAARRLHSRHATITGQLDTAQGPFPAGSCYHANAIPALLWVYATLIETAIMAYELVLPALTTAQRERYYDESRLFAALFGIPDRSLPPDWNSFSAYVAATMQSDTLTVSPQARALALGLIGGGSTFLPVPGSYRALTASLLPPRLREAFGFSHGAAEQEAVKRSVARLRWLYPLLPSRLRYVGPYQEAQQRLAGKRSADTITRLCNRLWIGQAELPKGRPERA